MYTLFLSDLHLTASEPATAELFFKILQHHAPQADAIYILGDLFETWIGDDDTSLLNQHTIQALNNVTQQGVPIYIMHGNRDLLIGKQFLKASGCQLLPDPTVINLYGAQTLLMHGDTLCLEDVAYLRFRKKMHNPLIQKIFLFLPLKIRKKIAEILRQKSQKYTQEKNLNIMDANDAEIKRIMQQHQVTLLIHGHTHRPGIEYLSLKNLSQLASRIILSDWHTQGNFLMCSTSGEKRLMYVSFD